MIHCVIYYYFTAFNVQHFFCGYCFQGILVMKFWFMFVGFPKDYNLINRINYEIINAQILTDNTSEYLQQ